MAKHVPFAKAVNAAEEWAFSLLKNALPNHYWLLTQSKQKAPPDSRQQGLPFLGYRQVTLAEPQGK